MEFQSSFVFFITLVSLSMGQEGTVPAYSKAMLVGGHYYGPVENMDKVEVLNLEGSGTHCQLSGNDRIPDYPREVRFAVGAYLPQLDMPVVCGGEFDFPFIEDVTEGVTGTTNLCYAYDQQISNWTEFSSMSQRRQQHAASVLPDGTLFVSGGVDWNFVDLDTTEMLSPSQGLFLPGPTLPYTMAGHCQVTVGVNTVFVGGGTVDEGGDWNRAFILDMLSGEYVELANIPGEVEYPSCGLATRNNGAVDVVVQGEYTTYLLDITTRQWRVARHPEIGAEIYASSLQQGKETVYVIGGYTGDYLDTVYRYLPDDEEWEEMEVTIQLPRRSAVAISIPDEMVNC